MLLGASATCWAAPRLNYPTAQKSILCSPRFREPAGDEKPARGKHPTNSNVCGFFQIPNSTGPRIRHCSTSRSRVSQRSFRDAADGGRWACGARPPGRADAAARACDRGAGAPGDLPQRLQRPLRAAVAGAPPPQGHHRGESEPQPRVG